MSPEQITRNWLQEVTATAAAGVFDGHMGLVSRRVRVTGEPGFEDIDYEAWARPCKHEFDDRPPESMQYKGFKLPAHTADRIMFKTCETVTGTDGTINARGLEVLLELEDDGVWRGTQEHIPPPE